MPAFSPAPAPRPASGTSVRLKSGDLVGAARAADLWDFCGAAHGKV